ncbi:MAG: CbtB domain-containing protein [Nitrospinota bacterium]
MAEQTGSTTHHAQGLAAARWRAALAPSLAALFLGLALVAAAGFAGSEAIHEAAHDARHAIGFPCH